MSEELEETVEILAEGECFKEHENEIIIKVNNDTAILKKSGNIYSSGEELPSPLYFNDITSFNLRKEYTSKKIKKILPKVESDSQNENISKCTEQFVSNSKYSVNIQEKNTQLFDNFKKCIRGYHLINSSPINETVWEDINAIVFSSSGIKIYSKSEGSHCSGMDIDSSFGRISNKSSKYSNNKKSIDISSYRLTTICSEKKCGTPEEIIVEINKRKNFDYYSLIIRDENTSNETISYDWLLIPSNYTILDPSSYNWKPTIGKRGKNKNTSWLEHK